MGGGVPCECERSGHGEMAAGERGPRARQHYLHPGLARVCVPHNGLQLAGGQDPGRPARPARHEDRTGQRVFRLLEGSDDKRYLGIEFYISD